MSIEEAVDEAVAWACEQNLLEGYIREQKAEVKMNLLTEYDEEEYIRIWRRDGRQQQAIEDARTLLADGKYTAEEISALLQIPTEAFVETVRG